MPSSVNRLAAAIAAAQGADQLALATMPLVATLALGLGPGPVAVLVAAQSAAWLLVSLPAGAIADRAEKRRLMAVAQALGALAFAAAAIAAWLGAALPMGLLAACGTAGTVFVALAAQAAIPALAAGTSLPAANARLELARAIGTLAAPAIAGAIALAVAPAAGLLAAAGAASTAAIVLRCALPKLPPSPSTPQPLGRAIAAGAGFFARHPLLRGIGLCAVVFNLAFMGLTAVFVPYALTRLGLDAAGAGAALAMYGAGLVVGAWSGGRVLAALPLNAVLVLGPAGATLGASLLLVAPALPGLLLPMAAWFLLGLTPMLWSVAQISLRQAVAPPEMLGRVAATMQVAVFGVRPLGALTVGGIAAGFGIEVAVGAAAVGFGLSTLVVVVTPLARLRAMPSGAGGLAASSISRFGHRRRCAPEPLGRDAR